MADQATPAGAETGSTPARRCRGRGRAALLLVLVALVGGIAGGLATRAFGAPWHMAAAFMGGPIDASNVDQRVDRMVRHFAIEIDASVEQQAKLAVIAKAAAKDLLPLRDQAKAARKEGLTLLAAATVDRSAIEQLRARQIVLAETASKRIAQAIGDAAEVLTPEQRKMLSERIEAAHDMWHR
jgi:Spy/CpxP family protein refolding chaperone